MNGNFGDARLEELKLLSEIEDKGEIEFTPAAGPRRDLVYYLVQERLVNDPNVSKPIRGRSTLTDGSSQLERNIHDEFIESLNKVIEGSTLTLRLSHRGRVRLHELRNTLRLGREREPFGILWDVRHWELDLQIAILESGSETPLAIAYLDMNGLKQINDTHGHDAGDLALKAYFQAVSSVLSDRGQAYRLSGGADEVLVMLPNCSKTTAVQIISLACKKLMNERLWPTDPNGLLSIAGGIVICKDSRDSAERLRNDADAEQKKAKLRSKETTPRPSVLSIESTKELVIHEHLPFIFPVKVTGSSFHSIPNNIGISFTITNTGRDEFPPYIVSIAHPKIGSFSIFPSEKSGVLLAEQTRRHSCVVSSNDQNQNWLSRFFHDIHDVPLDPSDDADFVFQLLLEDSNKVLYSNRRIGRGLARLFRRTIQNGTADWRGNDFSEMSNSKPDTN